LFYACGFVIVNAYLSSFGIREFDLAKPAYLSSGVVFIVFLLYHIGDKCAINCYLC